MSEPTPPTVRNVEYKGAPLDSGKGPGLGCFWSQVVVLLILLVLTPLSVAWEWPTWLSAALLIAVLVLLLFAGQTVIFLLRLVAADRRAAGRWRPMASSSPTVGEIEDSAAAGGGEGTPAADPAQEGAAEDDETSSARDADGGVRE